MHAKLEQVLVLAAVNGDYSNEHKQVVTFHGDDFNKSELETHLELLGQMEVEHVGDLITFHDVYKHLKFLPSSQLTLIPQVVLLIKLVLLMPATNAVSEQRVSAMHRIKSYLCTSMSHM